MFCEKCGSKIQEKDVVCAECGAPVNSGTTFYVQQEEKAQYVMQPNASYQAQQPEQWDQTVQIQQAQWEQPVQQPQWVQGQNDYGTLNKTSKKKRGLVIAFAAVLVAGIVLLGVTQASAFMTFARQLLMEPHEYYQYVETKSAEKMTGTFASAYQSMFKDTTQYSNTKTHAEFAVQVGTKLTNLLTQITGVDLSWLESIGIVTESNNKEDIYKTDLALKLKDTNIVTGNVLLDLKANRVYLRSPELKPTYLAIDLTKLLEENGVSVEEIREVSQKTEEIYEVLPVKEELESLMSKYMSIAISCITEVEKKKDILYANGVTTECTLLVATVEENTMKAMIKAVCEEMQKDKELKALVLKVLSLQEETDGEAVYAEFLTSLSELSASVDEQELEGEVELSIWINRNGAICGRTIEVIDEYSSYYFSYAFPRDGAKLGIDVEFKTDMASVSLEGAAEYKEGKIAGQVVAKVADADILNLQLKDIKVNGDLAGTAVVTLSDDLAGILSDQIPFDLRTAALQVDFTAKEKESSMGASLLLEEELFAGIHVNEKTEEGEVINLPSEGEFVMAEDEAKIEEYVYSITLENVLENLKNAGFPPDILDGIFVTIPSETTD